MAGSDLLPQSQAEQGNPLPALQAEGVALVLGAQALTPALPLPEARGALCEWGRSQCLSGTCCLGKSNLSLREKVLAFTVCIQVTRGGWMWPTDVFCLVSVVLLHF